MSEELENKWRMECLNPYNVNNPESALSYYIYQAAYVTGRENSQKELETTKKLLDDLQVFIHRFQEEFYLKNSASGLSKLYADIVEYDLAKLSKEGGVK